MATYDEMAIQVARKMHNDDYDGAVTYLQAQLTNPGNMEAVVDDAVALLRTAGIKRAWITQAHQAMLDRLAALEA